LSAARPAKLQPEQLLDLYDFEACPFCRKVREVLSELDLDYVSHPCGRGSNNRAIVRERGGRTMFPYLVDPNTGAEMYESEDIITYLHDTYSDRRAVVSKILSPLNSLASGVASLSRPVGRTARAATRDRVQPPQRLELYNFEASPYCRKVREVLVELNLDCVVRNVAKKSSRRSRLIERGGKMMVPYLIDPNTNTEMYESDDIVAYLRATYGSPL
jgi:glutathione S-transferase